LQTCNKGLEITGDSMQPVYRQGDIIIVSPNANIRRADWVVVRTKRGEVMAKILQRQTPKTLEPTEGGHHTRGSRPSSFGQADEAGY
jgi:SOS-response transcriptional repressor LexA